MLHKMSCPLFAKSGEPVTGVRSSEGRGAGVGMNSARPGSRRKGRVSKGYEVGFLRGSQGPATKASEAVVRVWANQTS